MRVAKNWLDHVNRVTTLRGMVRRAWCGYEDACGDTSGIYMDYVGLQKQLSNAIRNYRAFCRRKGYRFIRDDVKPLIPGEFTLPESEWGFNRFEMESLLRIANCEPPLPLNDFPHFWKAFEDMYRRGFTPETARKQIAYLVNHGRSYDN